MSKEKNIVFFTPSEVNDKLPQIKKMINQIITLKNKFDENKEREILDKIKIKVSELENIGCILRSADYGLVDFPAQRFGEVIFLCWKIDEEEINYWHTSTSGYQSRKHIKEYYILPKDQ